jgi:hypothetical protein
MASQFTTNFDINECDPRVKDRIAAMICLTGKEPSCLFGGPNSVGNAKSMLVIPFPYRSYKMKFRTKEFAGISIREEDRFSHWYLGIIANTVFPYALMGETIFSDK